MGIAAASLITAQLFSHQGSFYETAELVDLLEECVRNFQTRFDGHDIRIEKLYGSGSCAIELIRINTGVFINI